MHYDQYLAGLENACFFFDRNFLPSTATNKRCWDAMRHQTALSQRKFCFFCFTPLHTPRFDASAPVVREDNKYVYFYLFLTMTFFPALFSVFTRDLVFPVRSRRVSPLHPEPLRCCHRLAKRVLVMVTHGVLPQRLWAHKQSYIPTSQPRDTKTSTVHMHLNTSRPWGQAVSAYQRITPHGQQAHTVSYMYVRSSVWFGVDAMRPNLLKPQDTQRESSISLPVDIQPKLTDHVVTLPHLMSTHNDSNLHQISTIKILLQSPRWLLCFP